MSIYKIKNVSGSNGTWAGQDISNDDTYTIEPEELDVFRLSTEVFVSVANGDLQVADATKTYTDATEGWNYLNGDNLPKSDIDDRKIAVHVSYKPRVPGKTTFAVWTGAGDDLASSPSGLGDGELLHFCMEPQAGSPVVPQIVSKEIHFDPVHGRVWIHEGYLSFENGGRGDYLTSDFIAYPTPVQTVANKILYLDGNWVKYAVGSPNPATHGWAGTPVLIPRSFSGDGDWDYDGVNLTPNVSGTGGYKISTTEQVVHRYINKIPCTGTSPYFSMTSDETTELPAGYFIRINIHNVSNLEWCANVIIEIYRERTFVP